MKLYYRSEDGIEVIDQRKDFLVNIPSYIHDLWMPLLGSDLIGIYSFICRLARDKTVKGMTLKEYARKSKKSDKTIAKALKTMQELDWIKMRTPDQAQRRKGYSTLIVLLDVPRNIPMETIIKYAKDNDPANYEPLTSWFVTEEPQGEDVELLFDDEMDDDFHYETHESDVNQRRYHRQSTSVQSSNDAFTPYSDIPYSDIPKEAGKKFPAAEDKKERLRKKHQRMAKTRTSGVYQMRSKAPGEDEKSKWKIDDNDLPTLCAEISKLFGRDLRITRNQLDALESDVVIEGDVYPAPQVMYEKYPDPFVDWMKYLIEAHFKKHNKRMTMGSIVKAIVGYHWKHVGWFAWAEREHGLHFNYTDTNRSGGDKTLVDNREGRTPEIEVVKKQEMPTLPPMTKSDVEEMTVRLKKYRPDIWEELLQEMIEKRGLVDE